MLDAFWNWLSQQAPKRGTRFEKAVNYAQNHKAEFMTYLEDGRCSFSNNLSENAIRPFTFGRCNWMFSDTPKGAEGGMLELCQYLGHKKLNFSQVYEEKSVNSEYDKIKKVYSIWICMDADDDGDSISRISLKQDTLFGMPYGFTELDKMCGMVIRIRNSRNVTESRNRLIAMLEDVLSREDSDVKKRKLEEKYAMKMTLELEGRINRMCNLSDVVVLI